MRNILFYQYVEIADPAALQARQRELLAQLGLKGTVLLAHEGINGCLTGTEDAVAAYKAAMHEDERFATLEFKDTYSAEHGFKKTRVYLCNEIVASRTTVTLANRAPYIEPQELKALLDANEDIVLVDARNNYESAIGRFRGAITPNIKVFRDFTRVAEELRDLKDKPIVTYCTGGIRCEKASAVLREHGFTNVRQLHGGIIRYGEETRGEHWEGTCFVFDTRRAIPIGDASTPIVQCFGCGKPTTGYYNCAVYACDDWFTACPACHEAYGGTCSKACRDNPTDKRSIPRVPEALVCAR